MNVEVFFFVPNEFSLFGTICTKQAKLVRDNFDAPGGAGQREHAVHSASGNGGEPWNYTEEFPEGCWFYDIFTDLIL